MTIDELMKENAEILRRMKEEDWDKRDFVAEYKTQIYAHRFWNFDEQPPTEYAYQVREYIKCHPEEFKGAGPQ